MDYGHKATDAALLKLEKEIRAIYGKAAKETEKKLKAHLSQYKEDDKKWRESVKAGVKTEAAYKKWRMEQILKGKYWKEMQETLSTDMVNADKLATSMVNGFTPDVYALNHNFGTFEVEKGSLVNTSYTLYDRQTVERLIRDNPDLLPSPSVNTAKDMRWNKQSFTSGILQGILQGEKMDDIAKRVALGTSERDMKAALRNARTATTGAENAGRVDSYKRAQDMGIKLKQQWLATKDNRTRDSHRLLDGETCEVGKKFSNGCRYPGDPEAPGHEVWNCRCTLVADVDGVDQGAFDDPNLMYDANLGGMTYDEWKKGRKRVPAK